MARKRIGELLLERGAITKEQLESGLLAQKRTRQRLGVTLVQQGVLTEIQLAQALAQSLSLATVDLSQVIVNGTAPQAASFNVTGTGRIGTSLEVAGPLIRTIAKACLTRWAFLMSKRFLLCSFLTLSSSHG